MENPSNLLLVPHSSSSFSEILYLAVAIKGQRKYEPLILVHWKDNDDAVNACREEEIGYILHGVEEQSVGMQPSGQSGGVQSKNGNGFASFVWGMIKRSFLAQFLYYLVVFSRDKWAAKRLLVNLRPECILTVGDRHVGIETALIRVANKRGIPSLIVPYALSGQAGAAAYRLAQEDWRHTYGMSSGINRWVAKIRPKWIHKTASYSLLWNSSAWMIAAQLTGIAVPAPWSLGGGAAWTMAVESDQARDILVREGMAAEKLVVVGKPRYDAASRIKENQLEWRIEVCRTLNVDPDKPLLVCSVPQLAEHALMPWEEHWQEIDFLFTCLSEPNPEHNVLLSLHPKSDLAQYLPRAEKYGFKVAINYSYDQLIPTCDVFVATFSSTVTLTVAAEKPAVVVDFGWFGYELFDELSGVVVVRERSNLVPTLTRLFSDRDYYNCLVAEQARAAKTWARFDGKATERVLNLIDDLVEKGREIQKMPRHERRKALPPWSRG